MFAKCSGGFSLPLIYSEFLSSCFARDEGSHEFLLFCEGLVPFWNLVHLDFFCHSFSAVFKKETVILKIILLVLTITIRTTDSYDVVHLNQKQKSYET